jgi:hypothetical protein
MPGLVGLGFSPDISQAESMAALAAAVCFSAIPFETWPFSAACEAAIHIPRVHVNAEPMHFRAIAFELSWQANVSGCRKDSIKPSSVTGHDFSRAAN